MRGVQLGSWPWWVGMAFIGFAISSLGCANQLGSRQPDCATQQVSVLVAINYLSGKPWALGLPREHEQRALLRADYSFKRGDYTILSLCKEITRATGKRVEWLPDDAKALEAVERYWGQGLSLPPPKVSTKEDRLSLARTCTVSLGRVLDYLVSMSTEAELHTESAKRGYWTAWIAEDAIFLIVLPERHGGCAKSQSRETSNRTIKRGQENGLVPGLRRAAIVVPINDFASPGLVPLVPEEEVKPWAPDVLSPPAQEAELCRTIELREGAYSVKSFAEEVARASAKELRWMPYSCEAPGWGQYLLEEPLFNVGSPDSHSRDEGVQLEARVELHKALKKLLAYATEIGLGRESPDREVWTALLGEDAIFLIMLPDAF